MFPTYDRIHTSELLANHKDNGDDGTSSVGRDLPHFLHQALESGLAHQTAFVLELVHHFLNLPRDVLRVGWKSTSN